MSEVDGQMTVEECVDEAEEQRKREEFAAKLAYWRSGGGVPMVLPSSFRAAS